MELNKQFLEKSLKNLSEQYQELSTERVSIEEKMAEVRGAIRWINQTLKMVK